MLVLDGVLVNNQPSNTIIRLSTTILSPTKFYFDYPCEVEPILGIE